LRKKHFLLNRDGVVIDGYDQVSYFMSGPRKGNHAICVNYKGIVYYFNSPENKLKFEKSPDSYEPEYGGWCEYAYWKKIFQ